MTRDAGVFFPLVDDTDLVERAEALGYDSVWASEGQGRAAFGKLERWATVTDEVTLASGIVNVYSRTPTAIAQSIATLDDHSDGRALLGLGVAHPGVVEGFHGVPFERPLPRMVEYIELIRRYLGGVAEPYDGEFFTPERTSFWEAFEPERPSIPVYNAALGPANVRLTGEYADGWLPNLYPIDQFREAKGWLERGAERAGRDPGEIEIAMYVLTSLHEDREVARRAAAEHVAYYMRDIPGYYDRVAEEAGFAGDVAAAREADTLAAAADAISDGFLDSVAITGRPEEAIERVADLIDAGVDHPVFRAPTGADRDVIERMLETYAPREGRY